MHFVITLLASSLEITTLYLLTVFLDPRNSMRTYQSGLFVLLSSLLSALLDHFHFSGQFIVLLLFYLLLFWIFNKKIILTYTIDLFMACIMIFLFQMIITVALSLANIQITQSLPVMTGCLLCLTAAAFVLYRKRSCFDPFLSKYYRPYRKAISAVAFNFIVCAAVIITLWNYHTPVFWDNLTSILIIVAIIFTFNSVFYLILLSHEKQRQKADVYKEYGEYLSALTRELERRQHEYKNELNTIIGLAEVDLNHNGLKDIVSYSHMLLEKEKNEIHMHHICEDALLSAVLNRMQRRADEREIAFDFFIEEPFPQYPMPANCFVELVTNLLNNAFEYVETLSSGREVLLELNDKNIKVLNAVTDGFDPLFFQDFGQKKQSTKGEHRGFGALNILEIVKRYNGNLEIFLENRILIFSITFSKK